MEGRDDDVPNEQPRPPQDRQSSVNPYDWARESIVLPADDARWVHDQRLREQKTALAAEERRKAGRVLVLTAVITAFLASAPPWWVVGLLHIARDLWHLMQQPPEPRP